MTAPRSIPWSAHALETFLLALMIALLLGVLDLPIPARLGLGLIGLIAFCVFGIRVQIRCWGAVITPAFTRARISLAVFVGLMAGTLSVLPQDASLLWRAAATILLPLIFFLLSRWDDARTVVLLRASRPGHHGPLPDVTSVS